MSRRVQQAGTIRSERGGPAGRPSWGQWPAAGLAIAVSTAVQLLVGTRGGTEPGFHLDLTYHQDYWYYAGLARALRTHFPPLNPTFAGEHLTQHSYHLFPLSLLAPLVGPYLAMRVLNVVYLAGLVLLLRRYFPRHFGWLGLCLVATAPLSYRENPLGVDLLTRGFQHLPFFALLCAVLWEPRRMGRVVAIFLLPWVHGALTLAFAPAIAWAIRRDWRAPLAAWGAGVATAGAIVLLVSRGRNPVGMIGVHFEPLEPLRHLVPLGLTLAVARAPLALVAATGGLVFGSLATWLRYYFLFPIDFAGALATTLALTRPPRRSRWLTGSVLGLAVVFLVQHMVRQFGPFRPFDDRAIAHAVAWIEHSTPRDAVFLVAPTPRQFETDDSYYREQGYGYWLAAYRDLYVGFYGWAEVVGLPGIARSVRAHEFFSGAGPVPEGVDYVLFGPMERGMYPRWRPPPGLKLAFSDDFVAVFRASP